MKKFLFSFLTPLLVSLFFFIPQVKASTYTFTAAVDTSFINSDVNSFINILDSSSYSSACTYYIIFYQNDNLYTYCRSQTPTNLSFNRTSHKLYYSISGVNTTRYLYSNGTLTSVTPDSISANWFIYISSDGSSLDFSKFVYANYVVPLYDDTITFTYNNNSYVFDSNTSPTLYYLYSQQPPTPSDDTPVLTAFYTLVINKLSVITDFFANNTYLFALPLIPIFVLCIYLIKRSLIK